MKKLKLGVLGLGRGMDIANNIHFYENAELVAICDNWKYMLDKRKEENKIKNIEFFDNFDDFIQYDIDAVILANYATEHVPFAIKALKKGKHVYSEVLPCQTLKQAVELCEAVENSDRIYAYGENYCYMRAPYEMKKLYKQGVIGEFQYGEGEYIHNCESIWPSITRGEKDHWRNNMYANFYCTHSVGPIIHATGLRPVKVNGFESSMTKMNVNMGAKGGLFGIEMVTLENGGIIKSIHGNIYKNNVWFNMNGTKGVMESNREVSGHGPCSQIFVNADKVEGDYSTRSDYKSYFPNEPIILKAERAGAGHGGSDYIALSNFIDKCLGNKDADTIDVYEALDMGLCGIMAYRSVLNGGVEMEIPNMRDKQAREKYRDDTACTDPKIAGNQLLPCFSKGNPDIPDEVYEKVRHQWEKENDIL